MRRPSVLILILLFLVGVGCGGYLFSRTLPRQMLPVASCGAHCYSAQELAGLISSVVINRAPALIPGVVMESDTCVSIRYPKPAARVHYVLFPKRDIKNIATLTPDDLRYVAGCFAMVGALVQRDHLEKYRVSTNGPGKQEIAYLHFHLMAE
jgi:Diadenosine tetraphosphate (Ap4A) hydrolase and other HIT family hydrolases